MLVYKSRYSVLFKAIALVLVCLFVINDIAYAAPSLNYNNPSKAATLAPTLATTQKSFQEEFVLGEFAFSLEGVKDYINGQVKQEKEKVFTKENEWKTHRTKIIPDIYDPSVKGRINGRVDGLKQVAFVMLAGFLSSTGQAAFVDLTGNIEYSKEFGGIPVVYF